MSLIDPENEIVIVLHLCHVMSDPQATPNSIDLDADLKAVEDCTKGFIEKVKTPAENARTGKQKSWNQVLNHFFLINLEEFS